MATVIRPMPRGRFRKAALLAGAWLALAVICLGRPAFAQFDNHPPPRFDPPIKTDLLPNFWGTRLPIPDWADEDTIATFWLSKVKFGPREDLLLTVIFNAKLDSESSIRLGGTYQVGDTYYQSVRLSDGRVIALTKSKFVTPDRPHSVLQDYRTSPYQEVPTRFERARNGGQEPSPTSILFKYENLKWHTARFIKEYFEPREIALAPAPSRTDCFNYRFVFREYSLAGTLHSERMLLDARREARRRDIPVQRFNPPLQACILGGTWPSVAREDAEGRPYVRVRGRAITGEFVDLEDGSFLLVPPKDSDLYEREGYAEVIRFHGSLESPYLAHNGSRLRLIEFSKIESLLAQDGNLKFELDSYQWNTDRRSPPPSVPRGALLYEYIDQKIVEAMERRYGVGR